MSLPEARPEVDEASLAEPFAWRHFLAIVLGLILMIVVICSIATLSKKAPAKFSLGRPAGEITLGLG